MTYAPQIAMIAMLAMMSLFAAAILRKRWMQWVWLSLGVMEFALLVALIVVINRYS